MSNTHPRGESSKPGPALKIVVVLLIFGILAYLLYEALTFVDYLDVDDSFESTPTVRWYYDGNLPVTLVPTATHGAQAALLGRRMPPTPRSQEEQAKLYRKMVIPEFDRPVLTFWYRMFANDIMDYSDFRVYLLNSDGDLGAEIKRDGFRTCEFDEHGSPYAPPAGFDLGWRTASYDLSAFRGQTVTLVFEINNLHEGISMGIWTCVDHVQIVDATPRPTPPCPPCAHLPLVMNARCDPLPTQDAVEALDVVPTVGPTRPPTPEP